MLDYSGNQTDISMDAQQSGSVLPSIYIGLFDQFGNILRPDNTSVASLSILSSNSDNKYPGNLIGNTLVRAVEGIFSFKDIAVTAEPGSTTSSFSH